MNSGSFGVWWIPTFLVLIMGFGLIRAYQSSNPTCNLRNYSRKNLWFVRSFFINFYKQIEKQNSSVQRHPWRAAIDSYICCVSPANHTAIVASFWCMLRSSHCHKCFSNLKWFIDLFCKRDNSIKIEIYLLWNNPRKARIIHFWFDFAIKFIESTGRKIAKCLKPALIRYRAIK